MAQPGGQNVGHEEKEAVMERYVAVVKYAVVGFGEGAFPCGKVAVRSAQEFYFGRKFHVAQERCIFCVKIVVDEPLFDKPCHGELVVQPFFMRLRCE